MYNTRMAQRKPTKKQLPAKQTAFNFATFKRAMDASNEEMKQELLSKMDAIRFDILQQLRQKADKEDLLGKADKADLLGKADKADVISVKADIDALNQHLTSLLTRYMEGHRKEHESLENRLTKIEAVVLRN